MAGGAGRRNKALPTLNSERDVNSNYFFGDRDVSKLTVDGRLIIELIMEKLDSAVCEIIGKLQERDLKIEKLEQDVSTLKRDVGDLRDRLEDVEANKRCDSVIVSGSCENCSRIIESVFQSNLNYVLPANEISVSYRLGKKPMTQGNIDRRSIFVKLCRRETKNDVLSSCRRVKPPNFFVNEDLTPVRSSILYALRRAKRLHPEKVAAGGSQDGRVFVWIKASSPTARNYKKFVNSMSELHDFCTQTLNLDSEELLSRD